MMKVSANIFAIRHDFMIPIAPDKKLPRFVYSYILFGKHICLIDSGVKGSHQAIFNCIREQGRDPKEISHLVLSHAHPDHIGSAATIKEKTGCQILAHRAEKEWFEDINLQNRERPVPGFFKLVNSSVKIDRFVQDEDEIQTDTALSFKVIHTPGHSPGSVSLYFPADKLLFTGDAIPLEGDLPNYHNYKELMHSLTVLETFGNYDTMVSSWADPLDLPGTTSMIGRARAYLEMLDMAIKTEYRTSKPIPENCKAVVESLGLPPFFVNPIVDQSFRSHLNE